jgi:hypothetical protein
MNINRFSDPALGGWVEGAAEAAIGCATACTMRSSATHTGVGAALCNHADC